MLLKILALKTFCQITEKKFKELTKNLHPQKNSDPYHQQTLTRKESKKADPTILKLSAMARKSLKNLMRHLICLMMMMAPFCYY